MQIYNGHFLRDHHNPEAKGGTELMAERLAGSVPLEILKQCQIFLSRVNEAMDPSKIRIFYAHDLPGDPAADHLKDGGWNKFHRLVFVSNWQMQGYIQLYGIPWSKCMVMQNAIEPFQEHDKPNHGTLRLAYWATPHRGLNILIPVFERLCEKYHNIELDVYSSFKLYGWNQRDEQYKPLFESCERHPKINYLGTVTNDVLRDNLQKTHIMAYPSTWAETSCLCLMEGMAAGLSCVHPNYGALYETGANWTNMYQMQEDLNVHASHFYAALSASIESYWNEGTQSRLASQRSYANVFYNWQVRAYQWTQFLTSLLDEPREMPTAPERYFEYRA
jgi:UDP-glucose:(glucosyl)LPS alpha-1,2-glucosyltransferase